jgi:hypothetical protein
VINEISARIESDLVLVEPEPGPLSPQLSPPRAPEPARPSRR